MQSKPMVRYNLAQRRMKGCKHITSCYVYIRQTSYSKVIINRHETSLIHIYTYRTRMTNSVNNAVSETHIWHSQLRLQTFQQAVLVYSQHLCSNK